MKNIFTIKERYLIFREQAISLRGFLLKRMKMNRNNELSLDLSGVVFMSRSFADELLNLVENFNLEHKKIKFINQSLVVGNFLNVVKRAKKKIALRVKI